MAEQLGLEDLVPRALNNIGSARANAGDAGGVADLERAVETALAANNPEAARAYNNLASVLETLGDARRARDVWREGKHVAEQLGNATVARYIEGQLLSVDLDDGRWDECMRAADAWIARSQRGSPHYLDSLAHLCRGYILLARDDEDGARAATRRSLELAREAKDPQLLMPAHSLEIRLSCALGRVAEARVAAQEVLSFLRRGAAASPLELALAADELGLGEEVRAVLATLPGTLWVEASRMIADGNLVGAADKLGEHGYAAHEAAARLRAAGNLFAAGRRAEADEQLGRAVAFYRSVGATRYVREGEALLAATA